MNPFNIDWKLWLPVGAGIFLLLGHLTYAAVCPFIASERGHQFCVISSEVLLDLGNSAKAADDTLLDAGVR